MNRELKGLGRLTGKAARPPTCRSRAVQAVSFALSFAVQISDTRSGMDIDRTRIEMALQGVRVAETSGGAQRGA